MKSLLLIQIFLLAVYSYSLAQNPLIKQWDKQFGGSDDDIYPFIEITADSGYIISGTSSSNISGDKTQNSWPDSAGFPTFDYWIIKTDSLGDKQWDKRFGGDDFEQLFSIQCTPEKGFIVGGNSGSGISGDKSQPNWDTINATYDYWVVKIDSSGNKKWDKRFGGNLAEYYFSLDVTSDSGYVLGGSSNSGISGDKSQSNWSGSFDFWVIKIDSLGNKQWDKTFGGDSADWFRTIHQTLNGDYVLAGYSKSDSSGDKTQNSRGGYDYWILRIDSTGTKLWDKRYGGLNHDFLQYMELTLDGGYILAGNSRSGVGGDKTVPNWNTSQDIWIVKLDSSGNKQWDKRFGGTSDEDEYGNIILCTDGGYLLCGTSYSNISGEKSENNLGQEQMWIIKTDSLGNKQWDKTIFTTGHDEFCIGKLLSDNCYIFADVTNGGIGGYKTQIGQGGNDYWMIKFCDTTSSTGLNPINPVSEIAVFPNPFTDDISITIHKQNIHQIEFVLKNLTGQILFIAEDDNINNNYMKIFNMNELANGVYLLDINIDGERIVKKIVKE